MSGGMQRWLWWRRLWLNRHSKVFDIRHLSHGHFRGLVRVVGGWWVLLIVKRMALVWTRPKGGASRRRHGTSAASSSSSGNSNSDDNDDHVLTARGRTRGNVVMLGAVLGRKVGGQVATVGDPEQWLD